MKQTITIEKARTVIKCLLGAAGILCIVALIVGDGGEFSMYSALIAVVCIILALFVLVTCMKCPFCNRLIIRKCLVVKNCPHCGRNLVSGLKSKKHK